MDLVHPLDFLFLIDVQNNGMAVCEETLWMDGRFCSVLAWLALFDRVARLSRTKDANHYYCCPGEDEIVAARITQLLPQIGHTKFQSSL
jgi:hypothetical protein